MDEEITPQQEEQLEAFYQELLAIGYSCETIDKDRAAAAVTEAYKELGFAKPRIIFAQSAAEAHEIIFKAKKVRKYHPTSLWGNLDLYCTGPYVFPKLFLAMQYDKDIDRLVEISHEIALSCGAWYPYSKACIICDRPESISLDDQGRLHNARGPAIKYRDGLSIYSWHDVTIPEEWITGKSLTAQIALTWPNTDQRRAACEIIGWKKVLEALDAVVLDVDPNPMYGTLYQADIPDHGPQKFLSARCGTGRQVVVLANKAARTAREAGAMSYQVPVDEYNPSIRT